MSLKRFVAKQKIKARKREQKKLHKLAMERNKALKEAEIATQKAKMKEEKRQAKLKKMKAQGKTVTTSKQRRAQARKTIKTIHKGAKGIKKFLSQFG